MDLDSDPDQKIIMDLETDPNLQIISDLGSDLDIQHCLYIYCTFMICYFKHKKFQICVCRAGLLKVLGFRGLNVDHQMLIV